MWFGINSYVLINSYILINSLNLINSYVMANKSVGDVRQVFPIIGPSSFLVSAPFSPVDRLTRCGAIVYIL